MIVKINARRRQKVILKIMIHFIAASPRRVLRLRWSRPCRCRRSGTRTAASGRSPDPGPPRTAPDRERILEETRPRTLETFVDMILAPLGRYTIKLFFLWNLPNFSNNFGSTNVDLNKSNQAILLTKNFFIFTAIYFKFAVKAISRNCLIKRSKNVSF